MADQQPGADIAPPVDDRHTAPLIASLASLEADTLRLARAGDRDASIDALRSAMACLYARNISNDLAFFLAQGLQAVLNAEAGPTGEAFERAFHLKRKRGERGSPETEKRQIYIAVWVQLAAARGWKDEAKGWASDLWGVENIDRVMRSHEDVAVKEHPGDDTWERVFLSKGKPLPPRREI